MGIKVIRKVVSRREALRILSQTACAGRMPEKGVGKVVVMYAVDEKGRIQPMPCGFSDYAPAVRESKAKATYRYVKDEARAYSKYFRRLKREVDEEIGEHGRVYNPEVKMRKLMKWIDALDELIDKLAPYYDFRGFKELAEQIKELQDKMRALAERIERVSREYAGEVRTERLRKERVEVKVKAPKIEPATLTPVKEEVKAKPIPEEVMFSMLLASALILTYFLLPERR